MATTNLSVVSQRTNTYAETKLLEYAAPVLCLSQFGETKPLPKNKADNITFRRVVVFTEKDTPLVEGVTPTAETLTYEDVTVSMQQWGGLVEVTDIVDDLAEDNVLDDALEQCGVQMGLTKEKVCWGVLRAGTAVAYANGGARNAVNTTITLALQRKVVTALKKNRARPITKVLAPSVNYGTRAVEAAYVGIAHSQLETDIRSMAGFVPVAEYGSRKPLNDHEIGSVEGVRYILSPELDGWADGGGAKGGSGTNMYSTTGTNADVFPIVYLADKAFGHVPVKGMGSVTPSIIPPSKQEKSDPLGQMGYAGWKAYYTAVVLNDAYMYRVEVAATDAA